MNFNDFFKSFFDSNPEKTVPGPKPGTEYRPSENAMLAASKAMGTLGLIDSSFGLGIWSDPVRRKGWYWDLAVKLDHHNLKNVSLELLDVAKKIICNVTIEFNNQGLATMRGAPRGTEIPIINPKAIVSHRVVVVNVVADESGYAHLQKLKWSQAEALDQLPGSDVKTTHGRKTGGRQAGVIHVAGQLRQTLVITRSIGPRGYGFAACESLGLTGIYLQGIHMDRAAAFLATGRKVSAVLVQTLEGIQARDVKPA